ncbi:MAG TPA: hypothetical protein VEJ21_04240 [Acidimicrobiales bacterium]|nr:hypothetical protein [Acidimicrobiales bacterium]
MSPEGPDPLGRRALFWAPAERQEDPAMPGEEPEDVGKYALFSRFSDAVEPVDDDEMPSTLSNGPPGAPPVRQGLLPPVTVHCSSCGAHSEVDLFGYLALHVPFFVWLPGKGFTRYMTCPVCRRRNWVSASWTPWSAR